MSRKKILSLALLMMSVLFLNAQQSQKLTLQQAIKMGLENSKNLQLSAAKMATANAKYNQAMDATIPS